MRWRNQPKVVVDDQDADAALGGDRRSIHQALGLDVVEAGSRLVEQQPRLGRERPRDLQPPLGAVEHDGSRARRGRRARDHLQQRVGRGGRAGVPPPWAKTAACTFCRTVSVEKADVLKVRAIPARVVARRAACQLAAGELLPCSGRTTPVIALTSVVLPEPLGPITPRISPERTVTSTPRRRAGRPGRLREAGDDQLGSRAGLLQRDDRRLGLLRRPGVAAGAAAARSTRRPPRRDVLVDLQAVHQPVAAGSRGRRGSRR